MTSAGEEHQALEDTESRASQWPCGMVELVVHGVRRVAIGKNLAQTMPPLMRMMK